MDEKIPTASKLKKLYDLHPWQYATYLPLTILLYKYIFQVVILSYLYLYKTSLLWLDLLK